MKFTKKIILIFLILVTGCSSFEERVNDSFGHPTDAIAVYAAQSLHAKNVCSHYVSNESNERFYEWGVRAGLMIPHHRKTSDGFKDIEDEYLKKYSNNWLKISESKKDKFCLDYKKEVIFSEELSRIRLIESGGRFRNFFAVVSEKAKSREKTGALILGATSVVFSFAGLNQTSKHNFSGASTLNNYAQFFSNSMPSTFGYSVDGLPCRNYDKYIDINQKILMNFYSDYMVAIYCENKK